ncbi:MAG: 4-hydroxythreonine-4-phosphate dehydrogenase PdxA [Gammaproteobacteria bacterium]
MTAADENGAKTAVVTAGDPAGIGPDLCLDILFSAFRGGESASLVIVGDRDVLAARAKMRGQNFTASDYDGRAGRRTVLHCPATATVECGKLSPENAGHVLEQLRIAAEGCLSGRFSAIITAPVNKRTICAAGFDFCGQTEHIAALAAAPHPVMLLAGETMRVALATRHLPLSRVAARINSEDLLRTLRILDGGLRKYFVAGKKPRIAIAGLNPHAGEGGILGDEEAREICPAIARAAELGIDAAGPFSADSMFRFTAADCYLAMYHDQGLPVIKYAEFDAAVNCTLGLPFMRTSPDHGTAAELAGGGAFSPHSMRAAVRLAVRAAAAE